MRRRTRAAVVLWFVLAALGIASVTPSAAFDAFEESARDVTASVVIDSSAYNAISGGRCTDVALTGGSCTFTITNKGASAQTYTVTLVEDEDNKVLEYLFPGVTAVESGPVSTSGTIAVGDPVTFTAKMENCPLCTGQTFLMYWDVEAAHPDWLQSERTRYTMRVRFGV